MALEQITPLVSVIVTGTVAVVSTLSIWRLERWKRNQDRFDQAQKRRDDRADDLRRRRLEWIWQLTEWCIGARSALAGAADIWTPGVFIFRIPSVDGKAIRAVSEIPTLDESLWVSISLTGYESLDPQVREAVEGVEAAKKSASALLGFAYHWNFVERHAEWVKQGQGDQTTPESSADFSQAWEKEWTTLQLTVEVPLVGLVGGEKLDNLVS